VHQNEYRSYTPVSRLDLLHSIWVYGSFNIDRYAENTSNKAVHQGHYYSDKAPGIVLLALPAFSVAAVFLRLCGTPLDSDTGWLVSSWVACGGSLAVLAALGGVALFCWLREWVPTRCAYLTALSLFLGSAPLPYSTLLMSHAAVVGLLALAIWAGRLGLTAGTPGLQAETPQRNRRDFVAGLCSGLALASEFNAGLVAFVILVWYAYTDRRRALVLAVGMVPPLLTIPAYHWICFGNAFTFAYWHEHSFTIMHEGFFGIRFPPRPEHAFMLLFSAERGLFFWSPILLLAFLGYLRLWHDSLMLFWITYLVLVLQVAAISAYFFPSGGGMIGPRFLSPILPLLALPTALGVARFPRTGVVLGIVSILVTVLATAVSIVGLHGPNPLLDTITPYFFAGRLSHNLGQLVGLPGYASIAPLLLFLSVSIWFTWRQLPRQAGFAPEVPLRSNSSRN
jgi:hypothetical protein